MKSSVTCNVWKAEYEYVQFGTVTSPADAFTKWYACRERRSEAPIVLSRTLPSVSSEDSIVLDHAWVMSVTRLLSEVYVALSKTQERHAMGSSKYTTVVEGAAYDFWKEYPADVHRVLFTVITGLTQSCVYHVPVLVCDVGTLDTIENAKLFLEILLHYAHTGCLGEVVELGPDDTVEKLNSTVLISAGEALPKSNTPLGALSVNGEIPVGKNALPELHGLGGDIQEMMIHALNKGYTVSFYQSHKMLLNKTMESGFTQGDKVCAIAGGLFYIYCKGEWSRVEDLTKLKNFLR
jgi:hypothetical protein